MKGNKDYSIFWRDISFDGRRMAKSPAVLNPPLCSLPDVLLTVFIYNQLIYSNLQENSFLVHNM